MQISLNIATPAHSIAHCPEIDVVNENLGQQHKNYQYLKGWCMDCSYRLYMVKSQVSCRKDFLGALLFCIDMFVVLDMASSPNVEVHFCHIFVGVVWLVWLRDGRGEEECDWKEIPRLPHPARSDRHLWRGNGRARWALWNTGWHRVNPRVSQIGSRITIARTIHQDFNRNSLSPILSEHQQPP